MRLHLSKPSLPTLKRLAGASLLLTAVYAFVGFLILPHIVRPILTWQLGTALHRPVAVAKLAINPFTLSLRIRQLKVDDILPYRPLLTCDEVLANLELASLLRLGLVLKEVSLTAPRLSVFRIKGSETNFSDLVPGQNGGAEPEESSAPFPFAIGTLNVRQGRVEFSDLTVNREQVVEAIEITIPLLSSLARDRERPVAPRLSALVNGAALTLDGQLKPFLPAGDNRLHLTLTGSDLTGGAPYLPKRLGIDLTSGRADGELFLAYGNGPEAESGMTVNGSLTLSALEVAEVAGGPLLSLPSLRVTMAPSLVLKRELHLARVAVEGPAVTLLRNVDRSTNLDRLFAGPEGLPSAAAVEKEGPALQLAIDDLTLKGGKVSLQDQLAAGPFRTVLDPVEISLSGFTSKGEGQAADYSLTLTSEAGEKLTLEGSGTLSPLKAEGEVALTGLALPKYRPYLAGLIDFTVASGTLDLETGFNLERSGPTPDLTLSALALALHDLSCRRGEAAPFLAIPALTVDKGHADLAGHTLLLPKVGSRGGRLVAQRSPDGVIDLASLLRKQDGAAAQGPASAPWTIELGDLDFTDYAIDFADRAHPEPLAFRIGQLALHGRGLKAGEGGATLGRLDLDLGGLTAGREQGEPFLTIPALGVEGVAVDQQQRTIGIARVHSRGGHLACRRQKDGTLDLATLLAPRTPAQGGGGKEGEEAGPAWALGLDLLAIDGYGVAFNDQVPAKPFALAVDQLALTARDIRNRSQDKVQVEGSLVMNDRGRLTLQGVIGHDPLAVDLKVTTAAIPVAAFAPYWGETLRMTVSKGTLASEGRLTVVAKGEAPAAIRYEGGASLADFAALDSRKGKLMQWNSLTATGVDVTTDPARLTIKDVGLTDYFLSLVLSPEGTLNLRELAVEGEKEGQGKASAKKNQAESRPKSIDIGRVTLQGGEIDFADHNITPNFATKLLAVTGRVSGLKNDQKSRAEVDLFAKLANRAPIAIQGTMNPLAEELFVDLKASVKDVDLTSLTPYSGRYVGYTIRKGKLFLDTSYSIVGTKIDSQHAFLFDQFLFGDQVESREAVKAPVKLAVALLKNRKGEIHLDLPIKGDLSRPDFHLGAIAAKMVVSLITKAVTAPFALLGAMFGGEELRFVEFDPGSTVILGEAKKRLDALAQALYDRPGLNLEIKGYAAQVQDHEALVQRRYAGLLVAGEEGETVAPEKAVALVAAMTPEAMEKGIYQAYQRADFPKPRNMLGLAKRLESEEMKKLLLSHIEVSNDDLLALANERARVVTDYLLAAREIDPQRFSRLEPGVEPAKGESKLAGSRVDFSLR